MPNWWVEPPETTTPSVTGWWAERHESFNLAVDIVLGLEAGSQYSDSFGLSVTPSLAMAAAGTSKAAVDLSVSPSLSMGAPHPTSVDLAVDLSLGMQAAERYPAAFELDVTPSLDMVGELSFKQQVTLSVTPSLEMTAAQRFAKAFALQVNPSLDMEGAGTSKGAFDLAVTPSLDMAGAVKHVAEFSLGITPALGMAVGERYKRTIDLSVTPALGMTGVEAANPVTFDVASGTSAPGGTGSLSWSHAGGSGTSRAAIMLVFVVGVAPTATAPTYGGQAMTQLARVGINNNTGAGSLYVFGLLNPLAGTRTASFTRGGSFITAARAALVTYTNVGSFGAIGTNFGNGSSQSVSVSSAAGRVALNMRASTGSFDGRDGGELRYQHLGANDLVAVDTPGAPTVSFNSTTSSSGQWAATALDLLPA